MKKHLLAWLIALTMLVTAHASVLLAVAGTVQTEADPSEPALVATEDGFEIAERDIDTGYLLRENFIAFASGGSGWERVNIPVSNTTAVITNRSQQVEAYLRKSFVPQTGKFVVEFKVIPIVEVTGGSFRLLGTKNGSEVDAIRIDISDNMMSVTDFEGKTVSVGAMRFGTWNGIKLEVDAASNTYDLYLNGVCGEETTGLKFSSPADSVGNIYFGIDKEETGTFKLGTLYIYKGYDVYEDLISAGTGNHFDPTYDYNQTASARVTAEEHLVANNNTNIAPLAFDNNDETYWEHDTNYSAQNVSFIAEYKGNVVPLDYVRLVFAADFKGIINISIQDASGAWGSWGGEKYYWYRVDLNEETGRTVELQIDEPEFVTSFAVNFRREKEDDIAGDVIKLATFEAKCSKDLVGYIPEQPSDWTYDDAAGVVTAHQFYGATEENEYNVFSLTNETAGQSVSLEHAMSREGDVSAEFMMLYEDDALSNFIGLRTEAGDLLGLSTGEGRALNLVQIVGGVTKSTPVVSEENLLEGYEPDMWYRALLKVNAEENTVALDLNGWSPIDPVALDEAFRGCTWSVFTAQSSTETTRFYVDNIHVYKTAPVSDVPALEPCDTGDTILTMQACTLWREGTHIGWAALDREEMYYRKPILGWYDEGSAEVADWEIKFAVDHGINNFMYCWYREDTGRGPIQSSGYAEELWEGIFRSKYRDDIGFTLMYTNNDPLPSSYGYDDFRDNLVPYWIETFFKNPNYTKTEDGKPIFYIYEPNHFIGQVGDLNGDGLSTSADAKIALDDMRQQCIDAGFSGLYIATEYRGSQAANVQTIENCGYDAVFAYTWSPSGFNLTNDEVLSFTQDSMLKQRAAVQDGESFQVIPNISKSWDPRGWSDIGFNAPSATYMYDLEHYRELSVWVKDVFGGAVVDGQGTKLVMLDNWNEFSEGHWLMPTYGTPSYKSGRETFGYLDILREVFGTGEYEHTDYLPLEDGFGPYDTWYPVGWEQANDPYKPLFGTPEDDSVFIDEIIDYTMGVNVIAGSTVYDAEGTTENGVYAINAPEAIRLTVSAQTVSEIKNSSAGLQITMKYGSISLTKEQVAALSDEDLDFRLYQKIDISSAASAIREAAEGAYDVCDGQVYTLEIRQGGYAVGTIGASVRIEAGDDATKAAVVRGETVSAPVSATEGAFVFGIEQSECELALLFEY